MPLIAQAPGVEPKRKPCVDGVGDGLLRSYHELRATTLRRKDAVAVEALLSALRSLGKGPLLRTVPGEKLIAHAGDVEVAASRRLAMLVENLLRRSVRKQRPRPG